MTSIISDPIWRTIKEKVKEGNLKGLLDIYNINKWDYNAKGGGYNRTVLHEAAEQDKQEIADYLIQHGAEVNTKDSNGETPLYVAARVNSVEVAKLLLEHGAKVNTKDNDGLTPLLVATSVNSVEVAKLLLQHGAEVNTKSSNGDTPLHRAAYHNSVEVAKLLLQHGVEVYTKNDNGLTPLHIAARHNSVEVAKLLLEHGVEVNTKSSNGDTPLHIAARHNSVEVAKLLLQQEAEVNTKDSNGDTPLHIAARDCDNRVEVAKLLIEHSAEVDTKDSNGDTPLHIAARDNSVEVAKLLIEHSAEVDTKDSNGDTPLHWAARHNKVEVAKLLLAQGVEVNTKSSNGDTPLHWAARHMKVEVAKFLLQHSAEVNTKSSNGDTPLHIAASLYSVEVAKLLLEHGAGVNTKSDDGVTPLHIAARRNSVEVAKLLLEQGADISITDNNNESCLRCMQKHFSSSDLQDTFRALPNGVDLVYSNPAVIVQDLDIKEEFDDDVKSILGDILKEAIDKLPGIMDDPKQRFTFYRGNLYVRLVKEFLKRPGETTLLRTIYIALQAKTHCNQPKRKMLKDGLGSVIYEQFRVKIEELAINTVEERETKELIVIAEQIYADYMKDKTGFCCKVKKCCSKTGCSCKDEEDSSKTGCCCKVKKCCSKSWRNTQTFLKSSLKLCCRKVFHSCLAIGMIGRVSCLLGIVFYILDLSSDLVVGISDFRGFSQKLGIFEIALVWFTLAHENIRSANSVYTTEEEVLRIKFGRFDLSDIDWTRLSNLNWSKNRFKLFFYKLSCPFKLQGSFLSKLKATLYNILTFVQLRPVVDRLMIFIHEPISLREYYNRQAEQNSLKQFYLILEQLPELLVQFYTFQIVINNLSPRDIEQVAGDCYHYFDYKRMNTNSTNDTNLFCENLSLSDTGLGICGTVFRIFSMAIPFYNIPSGIASLEDGFRRLDPLTPKMSTILKIIFQASYTLMIPARLFMFAAVMHAVVIKEYVFGFIIFRVIMELLVNLYGLNRKSFSSLWRMVLFSIRDVFLISIRSPDAYIARPSEVSYKSLRKRKNLAVRTVPFICEGLVAALIIEQRYPCGKYFNYFKYLGWFCIVPLVFSVSTMIMVSDRFHPFKGRSSSPAKEIKKLLISIVFMGVVAWTFIVSKKRGSVELLVMCLAVSLHIVLVAGLSLYLKMSNKSKKTPHHKKSNKSKETLYTRVATLNTSDC